jgi:BirA family transcriptional regulator, biotin operon repressor / biotin---[acetyl-CoA-carboxylase] ligase
MRHNWPRGVHRDLEALEPFIAERGLSLGKPLEIMEEIDSTNDAAKRAAKLGAPSGALFVAESQTRGRGRQGRTWIGERGESILASVLLRLACEPRKLPPVGLLCGLAVRDAVATAIGRGTATIKWPNDVLIDGRKVAGVLVEAIVMGSSVEAVIIGVGINVHQRTFPAELEDRATSVAAFASTPPNRALILADALAGIDRDVAHVAARGLGLVHARITGADALRGKRIRTDDGTSGVALGIELDGTLCVKKDDGALVRLAAGEVHLSFT